MDLTSKKVIKNLFKKYNICPSKRLGQNFLIDKGVIGKVAKVSDLKPKDVVLEIGPGTGVLTQKIATRVKKIIAVEKDPKMCEILKETLKDFKNVKIAQEDVLKTTRYSLPATRYKIVANLPFYITSPTIRMFLESPNPPKEMILIVQKEIAQKICAKPPKMNLLAVSVQFYAESKIISYISKKSSYPQPKVDSAILKIKPYNKQDRGPTSASFRRGRASTFFKIVKAGFSQPRKQLANNLAKGLALSSSNGLKLNKKQINIWLLKNNIQPTQRAETLTIKNWIALTKTF